MAFTVPDDTARLRAAHTFLDDLMRHGGAVSMRIEGEPTWSFWVGQVRMPDGEAFGATGLQQESLAIALAEGAGRVGEAA